MLWPLCLTSLESCRAARVSLEWIPISDMKPWTSNCQLFVFKSGFSSGLRLWEGTGRAAEGAALPAHAHIPVWLFSLFLALVSYECLKPG